MPNRALVLVAAAVLEARDQPSTYSSRRPGRHAPTIVDAQRALHLPGPARHGLLAPDRRSRRTGRRIVVAQGAANDGEPRRADDNTGTAREGSAAGPGPVDQD